MKRLIQLTAEEKLKFLQILASLKKIDFEEMYDLFIDAAIEDSLKEELAREKLLSFNKKWSEIQKILGFDLK